VTLLATLFIALPDAFAATFAAAACSHGWAGRTSRSAAGLPLDVGEKSRLSAGKLRVTSSLSSWWSSSTRRTRDRGAERQRPVVAAS
jgi:hypothetical protein